MSKSFYKVLQTFLFKWLVSFSSRNFSEKIKVWFVLDGSKKGLVESWVWVWIKNWILYICYRNQQMFKILNTQKFLGLKISDFLKLLKKVFLNFLDQKNFLGVMNFKHFFDSYTKCIELNSLSKHKPKTQVFLGSNVCSRLNAFGYILDKHFL